MYIIIEFYIRRIFDNTFTFYKYQIFFALICFTPHKKYTTKLFNEFGYKKEKPIQDIDDKYNIK